MFAMPDELAIAKHLFYAVIRNTVQFSFPIQQFECKVLILGKHQFRKRDPYNPVGNPVIITDFKISLPILAVPTNTVKYFMNRLHEV